MQAQLALMPLVATLQVTVTHEDQVIPFWFISTPAQPLLALGLRSRTAGQQLLPSFLPLLQFLPALCQCSRTDDVSHPLRHQQ